MQKIKIFDTTLRDGEQTPGVNYSIEQKVRIAKQLEKLGVDIIEAGFPITSQADFEACQKIGQEIKKSKICFLARLTKKDIDCAYKAALNNPNVMIHVFIASSAIHLEHKLRMNQEELLERIKEMVSYAKTLFKDIEFSCEDASRTDPDFLVACYQMAIDCGAKTINIPDTVGYATPDQMSNLVAYIKERVVGDDITISVHIHQDLGMATASSLACVKVGCNQIECAMNGLGERAGNTALEEIACALKLHRNHYDAYTDINIDLLNDTSVLVATYADIVPQANKAIVGKNAFLHESGIHQDGFLKARETYEIINPEMIGKAMHECLVVGKHSGKHAMQDWLEKNGYPSDETIVDKFYVDVKRATDYKKNLSMYDLHLIIKEILNIKDNVLAKDFEIETFGLTYQGSNVLANIEIKNEDGKFVAQRIEKTPIKALFEAINDATSFKPNLIKYHIEAINLGVDSKGMVEVIIENNNQEATGYGLSHDILVASIEAYLNAINKVRSETNV